MTSTINNLFRKNFMRHIPIRFFIFFWISFIIFVSSLGTGLILMHEARNSLLQEKQNKLFALARLMDAALPGTFEDHLQQEGLSKANRDTKIAALNKHLSVYTDRVAASEPGIGVGYYSKDLDAIITYGPSETLGEKVKITIGMDHKGREVMATGLPIVQTAKLVRGVIMNCMHPIIRNEEVIGYIWSNELVDNINEQVSKMHIPFYITIAVGILFSFLGTALIAQSVSGRIQEIIRSIKIIERDPTYRIPSMAGELGEIAASMNDFAAKLQFRRRLEQQLQRADRLAALGEIAAGVAHEIRNPLTSIKGFVQLIETGMPAEDKKRQYTQIIIEETNRLNKMVRELLYYARPCESLKIDINVNQVLEDTLLLVNLNATHQQVEFTMNYGENLPALQGDQEQIKQIFLNLLINSVQAIDEGGHIVVTTMLTGNTITVVVEDDGKGIDSQHFKRIFDPFFTTRDNGTGLGLAVVQKIIDLHHGEIAVENREDKGTRFTIIFPTGRHCHDTKK